MSVLVTGGFGYIGSHTVLSLLENDFDVVVLDNLCNSSDKSLLRVEELAGRKVRTYIGDVSDRSILRKVFSECNIDSVIHFAALKSVSESLTKPLLYYSNNLGATLALLDIMSEYEVNNFIFSSSATVYGTPEVIPLKESNNIGGTTNPYGTSKLFSEIILKDIAEANENFRIVCLRYFNPVGAHPSGLIGESPNGIPNNLVPYLTKVAIGQLPFLQVYGNDYPTKDGTGVRDFIHVMDLAEGHVAALNKIKSQSGLKIYNLGTGIGYSVLELIATFERINAVKVPYKICPRRPGDIAECWSDPMLANKELGWSAKRDLSVMLKDSWRWQQMNPEGYSDN
ncbi:UDP-glucose 4-epimerase GalE [Kosakonia sacchari]|uniref:UDP-glucose 4-epimerase GalE n=1 Tax=Kosakonia sacchari TaxID=1158459 RepID=UPI003F54563F